MKNGKAHLGIIIIIILLSSANVFAQWDENFEDYSAGAFPSCDWLYFTSGSGVVVDGSTSFSGDHSLRTVASIGGCWEQGASREFSIQLPFTIEFAVRNGSEPLTGCHPYRGGMHVFTGPTCCSYPHAGGILFDENGDLMVTVVYPWVTFTGFELEQWQYVELQMSAPNDGSLHAKVWANGEYLGEFTRDWEPWMVDLSYVVVSSGEGTAWFDDISIKSAAIRHVAFDIKPGSCPDPVNVGTQGADFIPWGEWAEEMGPDATMTAAARRCPEHQTRWKAVLPAAIPGTEDFDVTMIDPSTIRILGDIVPLRWSYEDVATPVGEDGEDCTCNDLGPDGSTDLTLKFDRNTIITRLGDVMDGETIPVTVTGQLTDGTPFEGTDCLLIINNGDPALASGDGTDESDTDLSNFPNPFNPSTTISFRLDQLTYVRLDVFNITGQKVRVLADGDYLTGEHSIVWDGKDSAGHPVSSGIYFYRLIAGNITETKQMILLK